MKKMIKLSLAAAVAVAGLTTSATAGALEDSIKDTTISGKAMVGYNYKNDKVTGTADSTNEVEYDLDIKFSSKVNDTVTAVVGFQADHATAENTSTDETKADDITLTNLHFVAKTDVATVIVGKQGQPTPFFDDERGDGVVALVPAGPVTVAAGYFNGLTTGNGALDLGANTDLLGAERNVAAAAVIGTFGPVNASLWYAQLDSAATYDGVETGADAISLNLSANVGPVNVNFTHSEAEIDDAAAGTNFEKETLTKLIVSGKVDVVTLTGAYAFTNDNNNVAAGEDVRRIGVDLTHDNDAKTNFRSDILNLDAFNDAQAFLIGASTTFGATTVGATYLDVTVDNEAGVDTKADELDLTVSYAMSKNFSITGLYATAEAKTGATKSVDEDRMELSLNYKF